MRILSLNTLIVPFALLNVKKVFAEDDFLANASRPEFFSITDFKIPTFTVNMAEEDYNNFFLAAQCNRDTHPNYMKRNEECYTAPWVNLTESLESVISKKYIDVDTLKKSKDYDIVEKALDSSKDYKISLSEFENIIVNYSNFTLEEIFTHPYGVLKVPSQVFNITNPTLTFQLNDDIKTFKKVKISIGGRSTRNYAKLGYNVNIKGEDDLYGVKQLRFRSETVDPSFLRDKIGYDVHTVLDLPSLSANYAKLYFNKHYMGLYLVRDAFKSHWIEQNFGEKDTKHLYSCDSTYGENKFFNCINDDTEVIDSDWEKFLHKLENAKTREDLEKFFDVKTYIKWQVARYLFGSWDHATKGHNNVVYMYHDTTTQNDLWIPLLYDFDLNFGCRAHTNTTLSFDEDVVDPNNPLYKILNINGESEEVREIMEDFMRKVFNPVKLLPRIDKLRDFIDAYVKEDRTPDKDGNLPGRLARTFTDAEDVLTYESFVKNTEFSTVKLRQIAVRGEVIGYNALGLKEWMIERFRAACTYYSFDCSYADDLLESPFVKGYEVDYVRVESKNLGCFGTEYACCIFDTTKVVYTNEDGHWGLEGSRWCLMPEEVIKYKEGECWSEAEGYPCCTSRSTTIHTVDSKGKEWGVEDGHWCGITGYQKCPGFSREYSCCTESCKVTTTDSTGDWHVENGRWCSVPYTCKEQQK